MTSANEPGAHGPAEFEHILPSAPGDVASFDEGHTGALRRLQNFLHGFPTTIPFMVLLIGVVLFSTIRPDRFLSPFNLSLVLQQVTIVATLAIGQTLVILTAGIDLSVGAIMILCSVVMGRTSVVYGADIQAFVASITGLTVDPLVIAFPLGFLCGMACGAVNGVIITFLRLPPFIVTLGTWSIFGALNIYYSRSETIRQQDVEQSAPFLQWTGTVIKPYETLKSPVIDLPWFGGERIVINLPGIELPFLKGSVLTYGSILMVVVAIFIWYVLNRTAFGRHVYAAGDDPDAARLAGINTNRTLISVYTLAGFICAIAAWILIGRIGGVSPQGGQDANLDSITAVVIGGTSLFGGRGSIVGTLIGALIVGVFRNGLALSGLDVLWQQFAVGWLIIVAVTLDQWIRRAST
jgi:fructose transport system permease protein